MRVYFGGDNTNLPLEWLNIANGTIPYNAGYNFIDAVVGSMHDFMIYPDIVDLSQTPYCCLCERSITTFRNISAIEFNNIILEEVSKGYRSVLKMRSIDFQNFWIFSIQLVFHYIISTLNWKFSLFCYKTSTLQGYLRHEVVNQKVCVTTLLRLYYFNGSICRKGCFSHPHIAMIATDLPFKFKRLQFFV